MGRIVRSRGHRPAAAVVDGLAAGIDYRQLPARLAGWARDGPAAVGGGQWGRAPVREEQDRMRLQRGVRASALLAGLALVAAACGGGNDNGGSSSGGGGSTTTAKKIGIVFDIGGKGDKSFNDSADRGATEA